MAEYIDDDELIAYPGVAAPEATRLLIIEIINGLITDLIGDVYPVPWKIKAMALALAASQLSGNSDGAQQVTVQIDDYKETRIWSDGSAFRGGIGFTAAQVRSILVAAGLAQPLQRVKSIPLRVPHSAVCR